MNNQGDRGANAMQLIMDLEGKVRRLTDERDEARHRYWLALTVKGTGFWWGYGVGVVVACIVGFVIKLVIK